ncbi:MAG: hypothetical protein IKH10_01660 [Bacteroidetes bacterium]|nr:hypothetical protein [Bacteroidota bacterium]
MNFKTNVANFKLLLNKIIQVVPNYSIDDVSKNILLKSTNVDQQGKLDVYYSNETSITLKASIQVETIEEGQIVINVKKLQALINEKYDKLPMEFIVDNHSDDDSITIITGNEKLVLDASLEEFHLTDKVTEILNIDNKLTQYKNFQQLQESIDLTKQVLFKNDTINNLLNSTMFAIAKEDVYDVISEGLLFQSKGEFINVVAMSSKEGVRVARATCFQNDKFPYPRDIDFILPTTTAEFLRANNHDVLMSIFQNSDNYKVNYLRFDNVTQVPEIVEFVLVSTTIDGSYPNYEPLVPTNTTMVNYISLEKFINALKQINPIINADKDESSKWVVLNVFENPDNQSVLEVWTRNGKSEQIKCTFNVNLVSTGPEEEYKNNYITSFNSKMLMEIIDKLKATAISNTPETELSLHFSDPNNTFVFKLSTDQKDSLAISLKPLPIDSEASFKTKNIRDFVKTVIEKDL